MFTQFSGNSQSKIYKSIRPRPYYRQADVFRSYKTYIHQQIFYLQNSCITHSVFLTEGEITRQGSLKYFGYFFNFKEPSHINQRFKNEKLDNSDIKKQNVGTLFDIK